MKKFIALSIGERGVKLPIVAYEEDLEGFANHQPNEDGKESLAPWPAIVTGKQ